MRLSELDHSNEINEPNVEKAKSLFHYYKCTNFSCNAFDFYSPMTKSKVMRLHAFLSG